jgi:hypothetical protein
MSIEQQEPKVQVQAAATQRRYRTLAVVKQEAITRVERPLEDSVFVWPHLLVREFFASAIVMVMVTILSIVIDAPLREPANPNVTPNPAKAPWYFLGLQGLHAGGPDCAAIRGSQPQPRVCRPEGGDCDLHDVHGLLGGHHAGRQLLPRPWLDMGLALAAYVL